MIRRTDQTSSNKNMNKNNPNNRDKNAYSQKQLTETNDMSHIGYLERKLNEEITTRQESYQELFQMIKHLNETKKSKVPVNFESLSSKKLLSPNKQLIIDNKDYTNLKAEIAEINSQKSIEEQESQSKLRDLNREIKNMKIKYEEIEGIKFESSHMKEEMKRLHKEVEQAHNYLNSKIESRNDQGLIEAIFQKLNNQYSLIKTFESEIDKMQSDIGSLEHSLRLASSTLNMIENSVSGEFQRIEEKVSKASDSIFATKNSIEEIMFSSEQKYSRGYSETIEKMAYCENRLQSLERRMDLIYEEYLAMPLKQKF